jgi:hypothetical protein
MNNPAARGAIRASCAAVTAEDPHVLILMWPGLSLAYLGYIDAARSRARRCRKPTLARFQPNQMAI